MNTQEALAHAQKLRLIRVEIRKQIERSPRKEAQQLVSALLVSPPEVICNMPVGTLLAYIHGLGSKRITTLLTEANGAKWTDLIYSEEYHSEYLTNTQRLEIARVIKHYRPT